MKKIYTLLFLSITFLNLKAQTISFKEPITLFNLDNQHYDMDQPMIPYKSQDGKLNFVGRSGNNYFDYTNGGTGYVKTQFQNVDFRGSVLERIDIDNDGDLDMMTTEGLYKNDNNAYVDQFLQLLMKASVDLNKDGLIDFVAIKRVTFEKDKLYVLINKGNFAFDKILVEENVAEYHTFSAGDIDNDGDMDFGCTMKKGSDRQVELFYNKGNAAFDVVTKIPDVASWTMAFELYDIDGDKDLDIIMENYDRGIILFQNIENFNTFYHVFGTGLDFVTNPLIVKAADFNNDGNVDFAILRQSQDYLYFSIVEGRKGGDFFFSKDIGDGKKGGILIGTLDGTTVTKNMNIIDYDNDGKLDVLLTSGFDKKQLLITNNTILSSTIESNNIVSVSLFPNPTSDILEVKSEEVIKSISIYDETGRALKTINNVEKNNYSVSLKSLGTAGKYMVKIGTDKGEVVKVVSLL